MRPSAECFQLLPGQNHTLQIVLQDPSQVVFSVVGDRLAVVADQLKSANHLSHREEAEALGEDDAASDHLGP